MYSDRKRNCIMDNRLNYHTSITGSTIQKPDVNKIYGDRINYHTSLQSTSIAMENLKKLNAKLDENNIVLLAHMATNPYISDEDREKYEKRMKEKAQSEYEMYSKYINDIIRRDQNRSTNESECNN